MHYVLNDDDNKVDGARTRTALSLGNGEVVEQIVTNDVSLFFAIVRALHINYSQINIYIHQEYVMTLGDGFDDFSFQDIGPFDFNDIHSDFDHDKHFTCPYEEPCAAESSRTNSLVVKNDSIARQVKKRRREVVHVSWCDAHALIGI